jgi:hypothetical protein
MVRVKLFYSARVISLEEQMNEYLGKIDEASLIDVKITTVRKGRDQNEKAQYIGLILTRG